MPTPSPRQPQPAPLPPGSPRHARAAAEPTTTASGDSSQTVLQQRLQGAFLTIIGIAGLIGGVLFSIEAPRFTPVPVVFLTFWLVMVIVGKILFAGLGKLREAGVGAPAPQQVRAAAAVAGIVVAVGMMGFAATSAGTGTAVAAPCPGGGPATCGPTGPDLTFAPPTGQATAPGQQPGQQGGQDQQGIATSPSQGRDNGPGIQAQTPQFGTPGQQAPNIPGNEQPGQGGQQQPAQGQQTGQQSPVQTTAPGGPQQTGQQQPGQQTQSGQPSSPTVTVTKTESQCAVPGAGNGAGTPGSPGGGDSSNNSGGTGPDNRDSENQDGAPSWAYLVGEATALMTGRRGRKAGPLNPDGSAPTNDMIPNDQVDGENYKEWTTPDGKRTFILSENADAPSQYRFNINEVDRPEGGSVDVNDDGTLSTYDRDGNEVDRFTPWAYDTKTGEKIPTSYTRSGDDLIQTIDRPAGNDNPILADPPGDTPGAGGASGEGADNSSPEPWMDPDGSGTPMPPSEPWVDPSGSGTKLPPPSQAAPPTVVPDKPAPEPWVDPDGSGTLMPPPSQAPAPQVVPDPPEPWVDPDGSGTLMPPSEPWVDPDGSGTLMPPPSEAPPPQIVGEESFGEIAAGNATNPVNVIGGVGGAAIDGVTTIGEKTNPADARKIGKLGKIAGIGGLGFVGTAASIRDDIDNGMSTSEAVVSETSGFAASTAVSWGTAAAMGAGAALLGVTASPVLVLGVAAVAGYAAGVGVSSLIQKLWK